MFADILQKSRTPLFVVFFSPSGVEFAAKATEGMEQEWSDVQVRQAPADSRLACGYSRLPSGGCDLKPPQAPDGRRLYPQANSRRATLHGTLPTQTFLSRPKEHGKRARRGWYVSSFWRGTAPPLPPLPHRYPTSCALSNSEL